MDPLPASLAPEQRAFLIPDQPGRMPATALAAGHGWIWFMSAIPPRAGFLLLASAARVTSLARANGSLGLRGEETAAGVIVAVTPAQAEQIAFARDRSCLYYG